MKDYQAISLILKTFAYDFEAAASILLRYSNAIVAHAGKGRVAHTTNFRVTVIRIVGYSDEKV